MGTLQSILGRLASAVLAAVTPLTAAESLSLRSERGHFVVRVSGLEQLHRTNQLHGLDLHITAPDGKPAAGLAIRVFGERQYSPTPLPTSPKVRPLREAGHYRVEGLRFHMPGYWRLAFDLQAAQTHDRISIDLMVK